MIIKLQFFNIDYSIDSLVKEHPRIKTEVEKLNFTNKKLIKVM